MATGNLSVEDAFFTNMMLLGFDPVANEQKHNIQFNGEMFQMPNVKGMEVVFHFLFLKIFPDKAKEALKTIWPITDKKQAREFKALAHGFLVQLEKEGKLPPNTVRLSHLHTCSGDRFCHMVWHLSNHGLRCALEREYSEYVEQLPAVLTCNENLSPQQMPNRIKALKLHIARQSKLFLEKAQQSLRAQNQWQYAIKDLENEYCEVKEKSSQLDQQRREFNSTVDQQIFSEEAFAEREKKVDQIRTAWKYIQDHYEVNGKNRDMVESIMNNKANAYRLDAKELQVDLSELIVNKTLADNQPIKDPIVDGNLDATNFCELWNRTNKKLQQKMQVLNASRNDDKENCNPQRTSFGSREIMFATVKNLSSQHASHAANINALNSRLRSVLLEAQANIRELRAQIEAKTNSSDDSAVQVAPQDLTVMTPRKSHKSRLDLVPPTPRPKLSGVASPLTLSPNPEANLYLFREMSRIQFMSDFDEEAITREISESVATTVKNSLRPAQIKPVQNSIPVANKPATPTAEAPKADPPAKKAAVKASTKKAAAKSTRSDVVKPWQKKSKEFGLSPIAVKAVKIESVNDATKIGTPEPKTVNNIRISLNKNSSKKSTNSVQRTPSPMQAIADQIAQQMISGQMSPINSGASVLDSVIKVQSVNNSSLGHYDEIHEDFPNKAMDINLDDDSDLNDLMSRVERVGHDSDDDVHDDVEQTETELVDHEEQPQHDEEEVDSNHDDNSRAVSDENNDTADTSSSNMTGGSAHTFDSAVTIKLDSDAELPVIRPEDITTLADDEQFTEQSGTFTEEQSSSSIHEPAKGDEFAWNLDASSDNLLDLSTSSLLKQVKSNSVDLDLSQIDNSEVLNLSQFNIQAEFLGGEDEGDARADFDQLELLNTSMPSDPASPPMKSIVKKLEF
jgi:HAUS augmin-like complex subunit 6